jgi:hypothetical protein
MIDVGCPFCGLDPYEYVDVGIGVVPVAVNCCAYGYMLFYQGKTMYQIHKIIREEKRFLKKQGEFYTAKELMELA